MKLKADFIILGALLRKEILLMRRNPIIPKMIVVMPIMVMLILPLVATLDVKNVCVAVVDNDHSILSRRILADIDASEELAISGVYGTHSDAMTAIEAGAADVILTIPPHWSRDFGSLDIEANGVNATKGTLGAKYVAASVMATISQWKSENGFPVDSVPVTVNDMYNPTLNFRNFMIPALLVILLIIICGFLPALNLVSEKESGTIEAINVTPVGRLSFVMSKLIPFWIVGILVISVGMLIGSLVYGPFQLHHVGAWSDRGKQFVDNASEHIHDVRFYRYLSANGRSFYSYKFDATVGTDHHLCCSSTIFQRNYA